MPSYRISLVIGRLRPGVDPASVLPGAAAAARELTTVEASDLAVVAGAPRITVRFTSDDDASAVTIAGHTARSVSRQAEVSRSTLTALRGGRWNPI